MSSNGSFDTAGSGSEGLPEDVLDAITGASGQTGSGGPTNADDLEALAAEQAIFPIATPPGKGLIATAERRRWALTSGRTAARHML